MKSVCIVGAGPSGLVAAKTFKQRGYTVCVYEAAERIGGMWKAEKGELGDKCSPEMRTNLSRFTVAFADLSWEDVDLSDPVSGISSKEPPIFPEAWQVGRYLERYADVFGIRDNIFLQRRVVKACHKSNGYNWQVEIKDNLGKASTVTFDLLIVASGFFDKPAKSFHPSSSHHLPNIQHSSKFRDLSRLASSPGKIAVIGGGISGSEAAAHAAFQISNAKHSPSKTVSIHGESKIYHVINRPFYCLPRYLPHNPMDSDGEFNPAPTFLPLDLNLYNLSRRGDGEISAAITTVPSEKAKKGHEFLRSVLGGDQSDIGSQALVYKDSQTQYPSYTGITDTYTEFVRSGIIVPVQGWVEQVKQQANGSSFDISLKQFEPWYHAPDKEATGEAVINDVVGIVEATGYQVSLPWLDSDVHECLEDKDTHPHPRIPYLLTRGSIFSTQVPTIGFVGFYEGPYWGVMEMQARLLADHFHATTGVKHELGDSSHLSHHATYKHEETLRMRQALHERSLQVPQFWMADYIGLLEEFSRSAGISRDDSHFNGQSGPAFPSRYHDANLDLPAQNVINEIAGIMKASNEDARYVAAAVFTGMQGLWNIHRIIQSRTDTPGGTFTGTAHFHPRIPTDPEYAAEHLYIEEGTFTMDTGLSFPATRRYVYRYNEATDSITSWFADEDGLSVGALFNTWEFHAPGAGVQGWMAGGSHWCEPDTYKNTCEFRFRGARIDNFEIGYEVHGPKKNYSHKSRYHRPQSVED